MKAKLLSLGALLLALVLNVQLFGAPLGTAFTYQGRLNVGGSPAEGIYDLRFTIYDASTNGNMVGAAVTSAGTGVNNGLFSVSLDFGNVFNGSALWLGVEARTNGTGSFTPLSPRQTLTATPYALTASSASNLLGTLPAAQLSGVIPLVQLPATVVTNNQTAVNLAGTFGGNGAALTNIPFAALPALPLTNNQAGVTLKGLTTMSNLAVTATNFVNYLVVTNPPALDGSAITNLSAAALTGSANTLTVSNLVLNGAVYAGGSPLMFAGGFQLANFFAGSGAGNLASSGVYNTAVGALALDADTTGANNTGYGYSALGANTSGSENTAGGVNTLAANLSGAQNAAFGAASLFKNTNGWANSAYGYETLFSNTGGSNNTASGFKALFNSSASYNLGVGYQAGYNLTTGGSNIDIGHPGLATDTNIIRIGSGQSQAFIAGAITGNGSGLTNLSASQLASGMVPLAQLPTAVVTNGASGISLSGTFSGSGAGLTNLRVAGLDDGGEAVYQAALQSAGAVDAAAAPAFSTLSLVSSNSGAAPAFAFTLDGGAFGTVASFTGHEALSEPYAYVVEVLAAPNLLDPNAQMGRQGQLSFTRNGRTTAFAGLVTGYSVASYDGTTDLYTFRLESPLAWMALTTDYRVYQNSSVPETVSSLYQTVTAYALNKSLSASYASRTCTIQYAETALNFFSRLLEDDGVFYFFTLEGAPPTLTLGDTTAAYLPGNVTSFAYYGDAATNVPAGAEYIRTFQKATHESTKASTIDAYDFTKPTTDLTQKSQSANGQGTDYSFGAPILTSGDISARVAKRQDRQQVERSTMCGTANGPDLRPGYTFTLTDQTGSGLGNSYVVTSVSHGGFRRVTNGVATLYYGNQFQVIPSSLPFRPALKTPKPVAQPSIATVTGTSGSEIYTDQYGRIKVHFQWDRYGTSDERASGWLRVASSWAGAGRGLLFLPRMGDEVLVGFVQGDPDQPYVSGSFYNAANPPPYALPGNQTVSTIKTRSSLGGGGANEIKFEDKKGAEALALTAQKDLLLSAANNTTLGSGYNLSLSVGNDTALRSGHDLTLSATNDLSLSAGDTLTLSSTAAMQLTAGTLSLSASGGVVVGGASSADALSLTGTGRLNDNDLYLRGNNGDQAHGLGWYGATKPFGSSTVDGPVLYGCGGGTLGTTCGGQKAVLVWNNAGNVGIGTDSPGAKLEVAGAVRATSFVGNGWSVTNLSATNLTGVIPATLLPAATVTNNETGVTLSGSFSGNGAGLTNLLQNSAAVQAGTLNLSSSAKVTLQGATTSSATGTGWYAGGTYEAGVAGTCGNAAFNAGVVGVDIGTTPNSAGVVGSYSAAVWGGLGYLDANTTPWAAYFNGNVATTGNVGIGTTSPTNRLHVVGGATFASGSSGANQAVVWTPGSASWSFTSDRNTKADVQPVDPQAVLEKVAELPINEWNYIGYEQRHIGPMAQDFHAAFPLNPSDTSLNDADLHGVALAAIQGLNHKLQDKEAEIKSLKAQNETLDKRLKALERMVESLAEKN